MAGMKGANGRVGPLPKKLSDAQVEAIRYYHSGMSNVALGRLFGVDESLVRRIRSGKKHVRRVRDKAASVIYQAPPPELVERVDLDVWFIRRSKALLRGYANAVEKWEKEGRFEEPKPEEWRVADEYGNDAFPTDTRGRAEQIAKRAARHLQEQGPRPRKERPKDQGGPVVGAGKPDVQNLLYDPKGRSR